MKSVLLCLVLSCQLMVDSMAASSVMTADLPPPVELRRRSISEMVGENYTYTLDFLMFTNLAEGELHLTADKTPGRYRAELMAHTLGAASWLTGDRTQRYVTTMEEDGTGRLRTISHESSVHKRKRGEWKDRQKRYRFDYKAGKVFQERGRNGVLTPGLVFDLPVGQAPVDILTGFYNLRLGVYGPLTPGSLLKIPTFSSRGISEISVEVLVGKDRLAYPHFPEGGLLLRVWIDPEIFDTGGAAVYLWFDDMGQPARGIVENVIGLGDVHGHLREEVGKP